MKLPSIQQGIFYAAGAAASAGSVIGTHDYILSETADGIMAGAGAAALSVGIYFAWDIALNHTSKPRAVTALCIALACSSLSTWTIYQNTARLDQAAQQSVVLRQAVKSDSKANEATDAIETTQADIRASLKTLRALQTDDQDNINTRTALVQKGIRPNGNNSAITVLEQGKATRAQQISLLEKRLFDLTKQVVDIKAPAAPITLAAQTNNNLDIARLARAVIYDAMAALFLIFGSWYGAARKEDEQHQVASIQSALLELDAKLAECDQVRALLKHTASELLAQIKTAAADAQAAAKSSCIDLGAQLQQATLTCNRAIATAETRSKPASNHVAGCNEAATATASGLLSDEEAIQLIDSQSIPASDAGLVTVEEVKKATGWGRNRAESLLKSCYNKAILLRTKRGSGFVYQYPAPDSQIELVANVISLKGARGAGK